LPAYYMEAVAACVIGTKRFAERRSRFTLRNYRAIIPATING
jgi:hypothetical protein